MYIFINELSLLLGVDIMLRVVIEHCCPLLMAVNSPVSVTTLNIISTPNSNDSLGSRRKFTVVMLTVYGGQAGKLGSPRG